MLGDQILEETGKIIVRRVLDVKGPKVEVSLRAQGKVLGMEGVGMEVIFDWYTNAYDSARRNKRTPAFESDGYWPSSGWLAACEIRTGSGSQPVARISSSANFTSRLLQF